MLRWLRSLSREHKVTKPYINPLPHQLPDQYPHCYLPLQPIHFSQHSPTTKLRFPPHASFHEWRGICFVCCKVEHSASQCQSQRRCGLYWNEKHIAVHYSQVSPKNTSKMTLNAGALPFHPSKKSTAKPITNAEPGFDELLQREPLPHPLISLEERPAEVVIFMEMDADYYAEVKKHEQAVVMYGEGLGFDIEPYQVVKMAVDTGLAREEEIRVATLSRERYPIHLPNGLKVDTFIRALPKQLWDQGLTFQPWSLLDDAEVSMSRFKLLIDLVDLSAHLWRKKAVTRAISKFGIFLGLVPQKNTADCSAW